MGSGISLSDKQLCDIIQNELTMEFYEKQSLKPRYVDGIEIYEDFSDEYAWRMNMRKVYDYIKNHKNHKNIFD
jgi:hypothetical protein